ncbi:hypothetical protein LXL04_009562 [Taraxacum kok-saghyz]
MTGQLIVLKKHSKIKWSDVFILERNIFIKFKWIWHGRIKDKGRRIKCHEFMYYEMCMHIFSEGKTKLKLDKKTWPPSVNISEGCCEAVKYYSDDWPTNSSKEAFEDQME